MEIKVADSFWESIKAIDKRDTWIYKAYSFFKRDLVGFIKNIWLFRKALWSYRWWDHTFMLYFMETCLKDMAIKLEKHGHEIDVPRLKKVDKMLRAAKIIDNIVDSNYIRMAEDQLGKEVVTRFGYKPGSPLFDETKEEDKSNGEIFDLAWKLEEDEFKELWTIFQGQDPKQYKQFLKQYTPEEQGKKDLWYEWFDGSGIRGWWD